MKPDKFMDMTWKERITLLENMSSIFAMPVMVYIRKRIGFRALSPTAVMILCTLMLIATGVFPAFFHPYTFLMPVYAVTTMVICLLARHRRWAELCSGVRWHSYCPGISILESLPWPAFIRSNRRVNRFCDSALVAIVGVLVTPACHGLGLWLILSAFWLYVLELSMFKKRLDRDMDVLDSMEEAAIQSQLVAVYSTNSPDQIVPPQTLTQTVGVLTSMSPEIQKQIALRRAKSLAAPNNLVAEEATRD